MRAPRIFDFRFAIFDFALRLAGRINRKSKIANLKSLICVHLCLSVGRVAAGDAPQVLAQLGTDQIYFGESVDYQVTLRNVQEPSPPDLSACAADFEVSSQGDRSLNQTSVMIVNGRMTQQNVYGHAYGYRLTPKRAGALTVPAPVASAGGNKLSGPVLVLRVVAPEKQDLVVLEIAAKPVKVFPTQPFEVTLRILIKPLPDVPNRDPLIPLCQAGKAPGLQINWIDTPAGLNADDARTWLQKSVSNNNVGFTLNNIGNQDAFTFFEKRLALFGLSAGREKRNGLSGASIDYFLYELKRTFTAKQPGTYRFGPASLKGQIVNGMSGRQYSAAPLFAMAPLQSVEVRAVPAPRPPLFCGGIGNYKVSVTASPTALRVGDPLTLTLAFEAPLGSRSGPLDLISAPDLAANAKLAEDFDIIDKAPTGEAKGGGKRFAYGLRVKKSGPGIPPLTISTFDPQTERFVDVVTEPVKLNITESTRLNAGDLVGALPANQPRELRSHQEGIFQNVMDVAELGDQRVRPLSYIVAVAMLWLLFGGLSLFVASWRRRSGDVAWQRRQRAQPEARKALAEARPYGGAGREPEKAVQKIRAALVGLLADMRNAQAAGITAREAGTMLAQAGVSLQTAAQAVQTLETIEALEYGSAAALDVAALQTRVEELLPRLRRELEASRK